MTDTDTEELRAALAACPHKGPWLHRAKSNGLFTPPPEGTTYTYGRYLTTLGSDDDGAEDGEVIDFITACHPERIARLLDALDEARKDAALVRAQARAEALEDAARVCEAKIQQAHDWDSSYWDQACESCAAAIRAKLSCPQGSS